MRIELTEREWEVCREMLRMCLATEGVSAKQVFVALGMYAVDVDYVDSLAHILASVGGVKVGVRVTESGNAYLIFRIDEGARTQIRTVGLEQCMSFVFERRSDLKHKRQLDYDRAIRASDRDCGKTTMAIYDEAMSAGSDTGEIS